MSELVKMIHQLAMTIALMCVRGECDKPEKIELVFTIIRKMNGYDIDERLRNLEEKVAQQEKRNAVFIDYNKIVKDAARNKNPKD